MTKEKLLKLRRAIKSKKPHFTRQYHHQKKRLSRAVWRRPQGIQSKLRKKEQKGHHALEVGYGSPREVKGLTREGLIPALVSTPNDLNKFTKEHGIIIAATVGTKKRIAIAKKAQQLKLNLINLKDVQQLEKTIQEQQKNKQARRNTKKEKTTTKTLDKKTETIQEQPKKELTPEEQKKENDKLLTKRM